MTFHNPQIHGPMKMKIITTPIAGDMNQAIQQHEVQVNLFNEQNTVFFNQGTKIEMAGSSPMIYSVILYANGTKGPTTFN